MWPSEEQLSRLTKATSGVYYATDVVLNFIECGGGKPQDLVDVCLKYMDGIPEPSVSQPFHIYDFYRQFISNIQPNIQPDAVRILEALGSSLDLRNPRDVAHLLGIDQSRFYCVLEHLRSVLKIDQSRFYCVLEHLRSVLKIPPPELRDGEIEDHSVEVGSFLHFIYLEYRGNPTLLQSVSRMLRSHPTIFSLLNEMRWTPSQPIDHFHHVVELRRFAQSFEHLMDLSDILGDLPAVVCDHIHNFDFRFLVSGPRPSPRICHVVLQFLFSRRAQLPDLVRTDAKSPSDHQLIEKNNH
ncbi:hypothetical protein P691DRAFT_243302 [Macrolepiota fuliginosa MF-IS2]|uniref:Uncharacterized protein n=1 Tax=Macrolepiota fuliginosa MF-IS2 TaxID=1400762 RepID=A0A9P5WW10_9AGAR|nr:hypothetical protein P691DRAFT_243302 [Macrolepiota fuliginosa MF-IS2]